MRRFLLVLGFSFVLAACGSSGGGGGDASRATGTGAIVLSPVFSN